MRSLPSVPRNIVRCECLHHVSVKSSESSEVEVLPTPNGQPQHWSVAKHAPEQALDTPSSKLKAAPLITERESINTDCSFSKTGIQLQLAAATHDRKKQELATALLLKPEYRMQQVQLLASKKLMNIEPFASKTTLRVCSLAVAACMKPRTMDTRVTSCRGPPLKSMGLARTIVLHEANMAGSNCLRPVGEACAQCHGIRMLAHAPDTQLIRCSWGLLDCGCRSCRVEGSTVAVLYSAW